MWRALREVDPLPANFAPGNNAESCDWDGAPESAEGNPGSLKTTTPRASCCAAKGARLIEQTTTELQRMAGLRMGLA